MVALTFPKASDCFGAFISVVVMPGEHYNPSVNLVNVTPDAGSSMLTLDGIGAYSLILSVGFAWVELIGFRG